MTTAVATPKVKLPAIKQSWTFRETVCGESGCLNRTYILSDTVNTLRRVFGVKHGDTMIASNRYFAGAMKFTLVRSEFDQNRWVNGPHQLWFCVSGMKRVFKGLPPVLYIKRVPKS